jgi:hypothetical protein
MTWLGWPTVDHPSLGKATISCPVPYVEKHPHPQPPIEKNRNSYFVACKCPGTHNLHIYVKFPHSGRFASVETMVLGLFAQMNLFSIPSGDFAAEARGTASAGLFARTNFFPFLRVILPGSRRGHRCKKMKRNG